MRIARLLSPSVLPAAAFAVLAAVFAVYLFQVGAGLDSARLAGKVSLVNVFASWCPPCWTEHPQLMRLASEGVPIYGINYKDKPEDALGFLDRLGDPYRAIGADTTGRTAIDWGVYGYPETFIVDSGGRIRYKHIGPIMPHDLESRIRPILRRLAQ